MAKRLFEEGNVIIADVNGAITWYNKKECSAQPYTDGYRLTQLQREETLIETSDITNWITSEAGVLTYTETTLKTFLRTFTATS